MKTTLVVIGVIFLVLGGLFYFMPAQTAKATTTTVGDDGADTRTSYATVSIPAPVTYAVLLIAVILLILGFALPSVRSIVQQSAVTTTQTKDEVVRTDDGKKQHTVHERHEERHTK